MSLHLEFEPHSWYMGAAIKHDPEPNDPCEWKYETDSKLCIIHGNKVHPSDEFCAYYSPEWSAYYLNGMTGFIAEFYATTLKDLKRQIKAYRSK